MASAGSLRGATPPYTPFWGPPTSSEDWCEPNYLHSSYVAEWYNTLSSVPIVIAGLIGIAVGLRSGFRARFVVPCAFVVMVGLGSMSFHGTLQYWGQAMDELSMVYTAAAFMVMVALTDQTLPTRVVVPLAVAGCAAFTLAYATLRDGPFFLFFVAVFGALSIWLCKKSLDMHRRTFDGTLQRVFWAGQIVWAAGFILFWFPDKLACATFQRYSLHAWFHLCTAAATTFFLTHAVHCFYSAELAERTGSVADADGGLMPAPPALLAYLAARAARIARRGDAPPPAAACDAPPPAVPRLFFLGGVIGPYVFLARKAKA